MVQRWGAVQAIHNSKESWEEFREQVLMPYMKQGLEGGLVGPPEETAFELFKLQMLRTLSTARKLFVEQHNSRSRGLTAAAPEAGWSSPRGVGQTLDASGKDVPPNRQTSLS